MRGDAQVLKGHLDVLLLATLADGPRHGYAIKEALRDGSDGRFDLPTGTVYPALHRLERAGLIAGSWSVVDGRRRRTYTLTAAGHRRLAGERTSWQEFARAVTALLEPERPDPWPSTP
jgi:DNA-binding PadR family transcriptional regulator